MATLTIEQIIRDELPYLTVGDDISVTITRAKAMIGDLLAFVDPLDESQYNDLQVECTGLYGAYQLLNKRIMSNVEGVNGVTPSGTFLKKGEAGPAVAEFDQFDAKKGSKALLSAESLLNQIKQRLCSAASAIDICIPNVCDDEYTGTYPWIIVQ